MITPTEALSEVFKVVWNSELKSSINGVVKRYKRPTNSVKEDVIINVMTHDTEQLQEVRANVNIFVPNPPYTASIDGKTMTLRDQPNESRLNVLARIAADVLTHHYDNGILIELTNQVALDDEDGVTTFINNRVIVRSKNL